MVRNSLRALARGSWARSDVQALFVVLVVAGAASGCGGTEQGAAPQPSPKLTARAANAIVAAPPYVPATPSCSTVPASTSSTSAPTHVSGYRVCGPFTATRGESSFSCPMTSGSGPYRLLVRNGASDGGARTEHASIHVGRTRVLGPEAFEDEPGAATAVVQLGPTSRIDVEVKDRGGLRLEIVDEGQRCAILAPTVVGEHRFDASLATSNAFAQPELQLWNGRADGRHRAEHGAVSLDGAGLVCGREHDERWAWARFSREHRACRERLDEDVTAVLLPVTLRSPSALVAQAHDGEFTLQVVDRDATPPSFVVDAPLDGTYTNQPQLAIGGPIDDPSARVMVNGAPAAVSAGRFGAVVPLAPCWNAISVQAADACSNASAASIRVGLDTLPPVVGIQAPASGLLTKAGVQHVSIRFSDDFSGVAPGAVTAALDGIDVTGGLVFGDGAAEGDLTVSEGPHVLRVRVADRAGNETFAESTFTVDLTAPTLTIVAPADGAAGVASPVAITLSYGDALSGVDLATLAIRVDGQDVTSSFAPGPVSAAASIPMSAGTHQLEATIADLAGNVAPAKATFGVARIDVGPPDPARVAPANDLTVATDIHTSTAFLYTGDHPIQTGVAPGTIDATRVAVIRGQVSARDGSHVAGVRVAILDHPEFGSTLTRADGMFDLAVNGGGYLTVTFQKDGHLPVQRQVKLPWRDWAWTDPVVLVPFDTAVTEIQPGAGATQVARGSTMTDADGSRQATIVFPAGTSATLTLPDGTTSALGAFHVRATEYTVGSTGRAAMPAPLPPSSAYTYAVELSVDEAVMAGAREVTFSRPVPVYLENFLEIPVGVQVPAGYYDRVRGAWVPWDDGRVIRILSTDGGVATIDADGTGTADDGPALGITPDEARQLAALYAPGQTLWRVPVPHFSAWDFNYGYACLADSDGNFCGSPNTTPKLAQALTCSSTASGSVIECENQALGEDVPIVGTEHYLSYRSLRQPGRKVERTVTITIPKRWPSTAIAFTYIIDVAGQRKSGQIKPKEQTEVVFNWDGRDGYGRVVQGSAPVAVWMGWVYQPVLAMAAAGAGLSNRTFAGGTHGSAYQGFERLADDGMASWATWTGTFAAVTALPQGFGGWTLSVLHEYDPVARTVMRGDGTMQGAQLVDSHVIQTVATVGWPDGVAVGPDGSIYTAEDNTVRKIDPAGRVSIFAGQGNCAGPQSGVPARQACIYSVRDVTVGPDGSVYLSGSPGQGAAPVRRVRPDGIIEDFAGVPQEQYASAPVGDEGPAVGARIGFTTAVAAAADGSVYLLADDRIRRVSPDGNIHGFAGTGTCSNFGDGGLAIDAGLCGGGNYGRLAAGPDGSVYLSDFNHSVVRRITPDGRIDRFAGSTQGFGGDGGSARDAQLYMPQGLAVGRDGSVYIADRANHRIRRVAPNGIIETVAGKGYVYGEPLFSGDGGPATAAHLFTPEGVAVGPNDELVIGDTWNGRVRRVGPPLPGFTLAEFTIASEDGAELHVFSPEGRHLRTLDARTKAVVYTIGRNVAGRAVSITDRYGNTTRIERSGDAANAIVAPHGQRTTLSYEEHGYLGAVQNPAGEVRRFVYDADGLLLAYYDSRGFEHPFVHDDLGRLLSDSNPAGGSKTLTRTDRDGGYSVTVETALGQRTVHDVATTSSDEVRTTTLPDGTVTVRHSYSSGLQTTAFPDGTSMAVTYGPDPQLGMQSPLAVSAQVTTPSGLTRSASHTASITTSGSDPLSVLTRTDERSVNGRTARTTYDSTAGTMTSVSAGGRTLAASLDGQGRVTRLAPPGVLPIAFQYDASGRLWTAAQGARSFTIAYDGAGLARSVTDSSSRSTTFTYDAAGRALTQTLPGNRTVGFGYDASGNMTSLTPPGRPSHGFGYTKIDQVASYDPPAVAGSGTTSTTYTYDADGELLQELFPDSESLVPTWETGPDGKRTGRLAAVTTAYGTTSFGYDTAGRMKAIAAPSVALGYSYDGFLPTAETWTGEVSGSIGYAYDRDFRVSGVTVNGVTTGRSYDADALLTGAGALGIGREAATGRIATTTLGAVGTVQAYDSYGALATFSASVSGAEQYRYELKPDAVGRIATKRETIGGATHTFEYGYDDAGRLWTVRQDGVLTATYEYDSNGNRLRKTAGGAVEEGTYDDQDRMLSYGGASYTWRPNGELESRTVAGQTTWYGYDRLGNLRQVALPEGRAIEYVVDGLNRRVGKKVNGVLAEGFLYEGQLRPVAWLDANGAVKATFVYGTRVNVPEYMVTAGGTFRIVTDHLGSPQIVVDAASGAIAERLDYDEWGVVVGDSNPGFQPFGFAGGLYDRDTGLVRLGARDYDPQTGRWTNKDLELFDGGDANLYAYCTSDPVNFVDPEGEEAITIAAGADAALGAAAGEAAAFLGSGLAVGGAFAVGWTIGTTINPYVTDYIQNALDYIFQATEHTKNIQPKNWDKHTKKRPGAPEKGDANRRPPRQKPPNWKGPWPPKPNPGFWDWERDDSCP